MNRDVGRRRFLAALGAVSIAGIAGCGSTKGSFSTDTDAEPTPSPTLTPLPDPAGSPTPTMTSTATPTPEPDDVSDVHPAWEGIAREPFLGRPLKKTPATIVEFTDISCPYSAWFRNHVFPTLRSEFVKTGKATYVSRDFPHVKAWAHPATQALEAVRARNMDLYWSLKDHYYDSRNSITEANLGDVIVEVLANTDIDADVVVNEAYSEKWKPTLQRDVRAIRGAKVRLTPTFFLFRDGELVSRLNGVQGYSVFEQALDL